MFRLAVQDLNRSPKVRAPTAIDGAYSSASVAETSSSAGQGAKTSASVDDLAPAQLHLVHNSTLNKPRYKNYNKKYFQF